MRRLAYIAAIISCLLLLGIWSMGFVLYSFYQISQFRKFRSTVEKK